MNKKNCNCGFPQSFPIPHEHDQTDREKAIIRHFQGKFQKLENIISNGFGKFLFEHFIGDDREFILSMPIGYNDVRGVNTVEKLIDKAYDVLKSEDLV